MTPDPSGTPRERRARIRISLAEVEAGLTALFQDQGSVSSADREAWRGTVRRVLAAGYRARVSALPQGTQCLCGHGTMACPEHALEKLFPQGTQEQADGTSPSGRGGSTGSPRMTQPAPSVSSPASPPAEGRLTAEELEDVRQRAERATDSLGVIRPDAKMMLRLLAELAALREERDQAREKLARATDPTGDSDILDIEDQDFPLSPRETKP